MHPLPDKCINAFTETYLHNFSLDFLVYPTSILPEFLFLFLSFFKKNFLNLLPFFFSFRFHYRFVGSLIATEKKNILSLPSLFIFIGTLT